MFWRFGSDDESRPVDGDGLVERRVEPAVVGDQRRQRLDVGRAELRVDPPVEHRLDDRVDADELLEHRRVGRVAGLRLPALGQLQLAEQDVAELLRRADRELVADRGVDLLLEPGDLGVELAIEHGERLEVDGDRRSPPSGRGPGSAAARSRGTAARGPPPGARARAGRERRAPRAPRGPARWTGSSSFGGGRTRSSRSATTSAIDCERSAALTTYAAIWVSNSTRVGWRAGSLGEPRDEDGFASCATIGRFRASTSAPQRRRPPRRPCPRRRARRAPATANAWAVPRRGRGSSKTIDAPTVDWLGEPRRRASARPRHRGSRSGRGRRSSRRAPTAGRRTRTGPARRRPGGRRTPARAPGLRDGVEVERELEALAAERAGADRPAGAPARRAAPCRPAPPRPCRSSRPRAAPGSSSTAVLAGHRRQPLDQRPELVLAEEPDDRVAVVVAEPGGLEVERRPAARARSSSARGPGTPPRGARRSFSRSFSGLTSSICAYSVSRSPNCGDRASRPSSRRRPGRPGCCRSGRP